MASSKRSGARHANNGRSSTTVLSGWGMSEKTAKMPRRTKTEWKVLQTARQEAERRERILQDRLSTEAKWQSRIPEVRKYTDFETYKNRLQ